MCIYKQLFFGKHKRTKYEISIQKSDAKNKNIIVFKISLIIHFCSFAYFLNFSMLVFTYTCNIHIMLLS